MNQRLVVRALAAASAVVALVGVVAVGAHDGEEAGRTTGGVAVGPRPSTAAEPSPTPTNASTGAAAVAATTTPADGSTTPAPLADPDMPVTTTAATDGVAPTATEPPASSERPRPPAAGRYAYDTEGTSTFNGSEQPYPPETTLLVEHLSATEQRHTDDDLVQLVRYEPDGTELLAELQIRAVDKVFRPDSPVLRTPAALSPGAAWEWSTRSQDELTTLTQRSEVVGADEVVVDGRAVPCTVIRQVTTFEGDLAGSRDTTLCLARALGIPVRSSTDQRGRYLAFEFANTFSQTLRTATPAPD